MALFRFAWVAYERRMEADIFIETAKPPASSTELFIRYPLESRLRLFCKATSVLFREYVAHMEDIFVFNEIICVILYFVCYSFRADLGPF